MTRKWWIKFSLLLFVSAGALIYVAPTVFNLDPQRTKFFFKQKINLGLDLQGGVYMVLGVDFRKVYADVVDRLADTLSEEMKRKNVACSPAKVAKTGQGGGLLEDPRIDVECPSAEAKQALHKLIKDDFDNLRVADEKDKSYQFGIAKLYKDNIREKTISQSIEVIRNRIDEFGVAEPVITSHGTDKLSVELPGIKDVERAKELIGRTAKLEFKLVDESKTPDEVSALVSEIEAKNSLKYKEGDKFSEYVRRINELAKGRIPEGDEIAFEREDRRSAAAGSFGRIPYLLKGRTEVTGDDLKDAYVQMDPQDNRPQVGLTFNARGAQTFDKVTAENIRKRLAIVLDGILHSAPVIQSRIPNGRAQITLGTGDYNQLLTEAKDLAIVLRAGALPAQLEFLEQRVVGPSLGADSIQKGKVAGIIGCLAVFLFMLAYYRGSGLIADASLIMNLLFIIAVLVGIDATLTLPGIAGIALTVGIAVDSNVVIFERIREEMRAGKPARLAVETGFEKAFRTILDANVTNAVAATVLLNYGTGPIKGFAVTLLIGIVTTLFTAVFVSRLLFDWYLEKLEVRELSI